MVFIFAFHQYVDSWNGTQDVKFVWQRLLCTETACCPTFYDFKNSSKFLNWIVSVFFFSFIVSQTPSVNIKHIPRIILAS